MPGSVPRCQHSACLSWLGVLISPVITQQGTLRKSFCEIPVHSPVRRRLWSGCIFAVEAAKNLLYEQHVEYFGASARASMDKTQPVHAAACRENGAAGAAGLTARILTWNINGLRKVAVEHAGLKQLLDQFDADICECCCYAGTLRLCRHANTATRPAVWW